MHYPLSANAWQVTSIRNLLLFNVKIYQPWLLWIGYTLSLKLSFCCNLFLFPFFCQRLLISHTPLTDPVGIRTQCLTDCLALPTVSNTAMLVFQLCHSKAISSPIATIHFACPLHIDRRETMRSSPSAW